MHACRSTLEDPTYCGADNRAGTTACVGCGASAEGSKVREQHVVPDAAHVAVQQKPPKNWTKTIVAAAVVLSLLVFGAWYLVFRTSDVEVTVASKTWKKSVIIEALVRDRGESWRDDVPLGAHILHSQERSRTVRVQDGTTKVKVGQRDLGNGFFEDVYEDQPRYVERETRDQWIVYEVERWVAERTLVETRGDGTEPPWPRFSPGPRQREGPKESRIVLVLKNSAGKNYEYTLDAGTDRTRAERFQPGARYVAAINSLGMVMELR